MAIPLQNASSMRELDRIAIEEIGIPGSVLMEVAGRACAEAVLEHLPKNRPGRIAVVSGKGNNGGDGMVAARHLHHGGHPVDVFLLASTKEPKGDALLNLKILERTGLPVHSVTDEAELRKIRWESYDVVLDAIFGTGLDHDVEGFLAQVIEAINESKVFVVAVDIPSGVSADNGRVLKTAVRASHTVTFGYPKIGHVLHPGAALCGDLSIVDIGLPPNRVQKGPGSTWLTTDEDVVPFLTRREADAHKGRFGHLVVLAGSEDKPGAAALCCEAAMRSGAGLVTLAAEKKVLARTIVGPVEYMGAPVSSLEDLSSLCSGNKQAIVVGPGLGTEERIAKLVRQAVAEIPLPMVLDADGLNNLDGQLDLLKKSGAKRVLTPHPGEMARLLGITPAQVQRDRLSLARKLASETGCVVVLKGASTVVADSDATAFVNLTGNPGMATGGTGDVLTGMVGSFLAQGMGAREAALVGAYVHGLAGDEAANLMGQHALVASDLIDKLPEVLCRFESWWDDHEGTSTD
jgi:ADP-dependent NAD(P)H-hydrate dehydratase / NAD(P)H-hydrate epimerase